MFQQIPTAEIVEAIRSQFPDTLSQAEAEAIVVAIRYAGYDIIRPDDED